MVFLKDMRIVGHYNNQQKILLVGEGDFSFAACLASTFGFAPNLVATSLDSRGRVMSTYSQGEKNLKELEHRGTVVIHRVNVDTMNTHPRLEGTRFDRIVFNFPHAGDAYCGREYYSCYIKHHQQVVSGFLEAARDMLTEDGEIHVTHKTTYPYNLWEVVKLGEKAGLMLVREMDFIRSDYPGYVNRKSYGRYSWDSSFHVGDCSTFVFCTRPGHLMYGLLCAS